MMKFGCRLVFVVLIILALGLLRASSGATSSTSVIDKTRELLKVAEELRGLEFEGELDVELVDREGMNRVIQKELDEQLTEEMDRKFSALYAFLGLIEPGSSLREQYQAMAEEQVAGLYDPGDKKFYVMDIDMESALESMFGDLGILGDFIGGFIEGLGFDLSDTIIVHELTHAIDDQHFDIQGKIEYLQEMNSDDAQLAYQSLLEGSATKVMNDFQVRSVGLDPSLIGELNMVEPAMLEGLMDFGPFLERVIITPYLYGDAFVRHVLTEEGQDGLNIAFRDPPESMEQILHPERYTRRDRPSVVHEPDMLRTLPDWSREAVDTLGELLISLIVEINLGDEELGKQVGEGWDGDRITSWRGPEGELAICWVTVWDDEKEAKEFYNAAVRILELKYPGKGEKEWDVAFFKDRGSAGAVEIKGNVVVIVDGVPPSKVEECIDDAWDTPIMIR